MTATPSNRPRRRVTRKSVIVAERIAKTCIAFGGIGTTVAVALMGLFLFSVVVPLFRGADIEAEGSFEGRAAEPLHVAVDEHGLLAAVFTKDGRVIVQSVADGALVEELELFGDAELTAFAFPPGLGEVALGFADGSVRLGKIDFATQFFDRGTAPEAIVDLNAGSVRVWDGGLAQVTPTDQLRVQRLDFTLDEPLVLGTEAAIRLLDVKRGPSSLTLVALNAAGGLNLYSISERRNLLTGKVTRSFDRTELPWVVKPGVRPAFLGISGLGDQVFAAYEDGTALRYDVREGQEPRVVEELDLVPEDGATLTAMEFLVGGTTLLTGNSLGSVAAWFRVEREGADSLDGAELARAHVLEGADSPVTSVAPSSQSRMVAVGHANGELDLYYVTRAKRLARTESVPGGLASLVFAPRENLLVAAGDGQLGRWAVDPAYPEVGLDSLFGSLWYEGYPEPTAHVWQSTGGTDDFEPKLGLRVLVFGTIKGTVYSLLFGAPIALLAALFTSEFLNKRLRTPIKSLVELMAGLPSVVLGFLAGAVIAPFVQFRLAGVLLTFLCFPFVVLLGAQLWSLLPRRTQLRLEAGPRLLAIGVTGALGLGLALLLGPLVENLFFGANLEGWLDGGEGGTTAAWGFLFFPLGVLAAVFAWGRLGEPALERSGLVTARPALASLLRFAGVTATGVFLAWLLAAALNGAGADPRGGPIGTYVQRNTLVVGFVMGFAIIPIIYTLAEDALSGVPEHLRLASLGCGATPWQTAVRVIVPTAGSGLLSAVMIGLGRAVGETMIVLMATGNTPLRDWNLFNGFRTLAANIAVELPEAVQGSSHYRTLFLAALVLFGMTFALNTLAERLRASSRKRGVQL